MKKLTLTIAIVLGLSISTFAFPNTSNSGGLFQRGNNVEETHFLGRTAQSEPLLPNHGELGNMDADETPVGSGIAVLLGLGAAYLVGKKRREE